MRYTVLEFVCGEFVVVNAAPVHAFRVWECELHAVEDCPVGDPVSGAVFSYEGFVGCDGVVAFFQYVVSGFVVVRPLRRTPLLPVPQV